MRFKIKALSALLSIVMVFTFVLPYLETVKADAGIPLLSEVSIEAKEDLINLLDNFNNVSVKFKSHPDKGKVTLPLISSTNDVDITEGIEVYVGERKLFTLNKKKDGDVYSIKSENPAGLH